MAYLDELLEFIKYDDSDFEILDRTVTFGYETEFGQLQAWFLVDTSEIIMLQAESYRDGELYRWVHPDVVERFEDKYHGLIRNAITTDVFEDMAQKAVAMLNNRKYNTDVYVALKDITEDQVTILEKLAAAEGITFDELICKELKRIIDEEDKEGEQIV